MKRIVTLTIFYSVFSDIPDIRTPYPYAEYSTKRALTMQRLLGMPLDIFCKTADQQAKKPVICCAGLFMRWPMYNVVHADPHGGNYLFQQDGAIGILDFGCKTI